MKIITLIMLFTHTVHSLLSLRSLHSCCSIRYTRNSPLLLTSLTCSLNKDVNNSTPFVISFDELFLNVHYVSDIYQTVNKDRIYFTYKGRDCVYYITDYNQVKIIELIFKEAKKIVKIIPNYSL